MTTALADRYTKGMNLAKKAEYDRAHQLLAECVIADPANYDYVDGLLLNLARRVRQNGAAAGPGDGLRGAISQAVDVEDWAEVVRLGTQSLSLNPWHVPTLFALVGACAAKGFEEAELRLILIC